MRISVDGINCERFRQQEVVYLLSAIAIEVAGIVLYYLENKRKLEWIDNNINLKLYRILPQNVAVSSS